MPIELTGAHPPEHRLQLGDVIMVAMDLPDKNDRTRKKMFTWRFFALVTRVGPRQRHVMCVVLDEREREERTLIFGDKTKVWYLPEDEWPDGVYAFRTKLILEGRIEGMI